MNIQVVLRFVAIALATSVSILFFMTIPKATANDQQKSLSVVLIGDSYTAGNGASSYTGTRGSYQSSKNWGSRYVSWLNTQNIKTTLTNLAHTGKATDKVRDEQILKIPANTDLVMLTVGGNDIDSAEVVKQFFAVGFRDPAGCREQVEGATSRFPNAVNGTRDVFENLKNRLLPDAQIVLVGYPLLSLDKTYVLEQCLEMDTHTNHWLTPDEYSVLDKRFGDINGTLGFIRGSHAFLTETEYHYKNDAY